ncbi:hypothetical protein F4677DRAFT_132977 [Hypoxylon crocopeplum]|nr:hypothetical protein F4677DRAFT_132977 [Hypoxylon crocopeplum]
MVKFGVSLLLLWSFWSTGGAELSSATPTGYTLNGEKQNGGGSEATDSKWAVTATGNEDGEQVLQYQGPTRTLDALISTTATPGFRTIVLPPYFYLESRQDGGADPNDEDENGDDDDNDEDDNDGGEDDEAKPSAPSADPPATLDSAGAASSSISTSVSNSVSTSVALSVSSLFSSSLSTISASASSAIQSAIEAGRSEGASSATGGAGAPVTTTTPGTSSPVATTSSGASAAPAITTDNPDVVASIQASASNAIAEAEANASSSVQRALEAARASASAAVASASSGSAQGSSLTPGQIAGIVIAIAIISSLLAALATYLLMRQRRRRRQEPLGKFDPDSPPESRDREDRLPSFQMYSAPTGTGHQRAPTLSHDFLPDVKQQHSPTTPGTEHPAMSYTARPLSMPGPDCPDPVFPVSPLCPSSSQAPAFSSRSLTGAERQCPLGTDGAAGPVVSLARQESLSGRQRAQLVRVGSNRSNRSRTDGEPDPLAMNPVRVETGPRQIAMQPPPLPKDDGYAPRETELPSPLTPSEPSTPSSLSVQAPVPRRPVDPVSLEQSRSREVSW